MFKTLVTHDHWEDPGGRTLESLEEFLTDKTGTKVQLNELVLVKSLDEFRAAVFRLYDNN